jgi:hypothetical protein
MTNQDTEFGAVEDSHGRRVKVVADRSGAVRLDLGLTDLMFTAEQWAELTARGDRAIRLGVLRRNLRRRPRA